MNHFNHSDASSVSLLFRYFSFLLLFPPRAKFPFMPLFFMLLLREMLFSLPRQHVSQTKMIAGMSLHFFLALEVFVISGGMCMCVFFAVCYRVRSLVCAFMCDQ